MLGGNLFTAHCSVFDVIDHIDDFIPKPTDTEWKKLDEIVKFWLYGSFSQSLLNIMLKHTVHRVSKNLKSLFYDNKDAKSMQINIELHNIYMVDLTVTVYCTVTKGST